MATTDNDPAVDRTITVEERIEELRKRQKAALTPDGRKDAVRRSSTRRGKLTARERLEVLMDTGSFVGDRSLRDPPLARLRDGTQPARRATASITGYGTIDGRKVFVASQDFTVFGGSMGEVHAQKVCKVMDLAMSTGAPVHPDQRLGRRADPGGRREPRGLRLHLRAERARLAA